MKATSLALIFSLGVTAVHAKQPSVSPPVRVGIDVLRDSGFDLLIGRKVGLITNHTGLNAEGQSTAKVLHDAAEVELVALFSPEHGIAGKLDQANIDDTTDPTTGLAVLSLYGANRKPSPESLQNIDTLVFDIQDIGTRFYTYISTMGSAMEAASESDIRFVVLDRPNPINAVDVQGPVTDRGLESFVAFHPIPIRHGMTVGELASMFRSERRWKLDLHVVPVANWSRDMWFDQCGVRWTNPSPNMRSLTQATLYPGIGIIETTNVSVGRGTDTPFEVVGAPWIDELQLASALNSAKLPGTSFVPIRFVPDASKHQGVLCGGVNIMITNRDQFDPLATGLCLASSLARLYPVHWDSSSLNRLLCDEATMQRILRGESWQNIQNSYSKEINKFLERRKDYLIDSYEPVTDRGERK